MIIRPELPADIAAVHALNAAAFQLPELTGGYLDGRSGTIRYHSAFAGV